MTIDSLGDADRAVAVREFEDRNAPDFARLTKNLLKKGDLTYTGRKSEANLEQKAAIALYIAQKTLINNDWTLFFDAGSTVRIVARAMFMRANEIHGNYIVTTNNLDISEDFFSRQEPYSPEAFTALKLQLTGGRYDPEHHALFGGLARQAIESLGFDAVIIGVTGFTSLKGVFFHGATEEEVVKTALYTKRTKLRVFAFDHTKLGTEDQYPCLDPQRRGIEVLCNSARKTIIVTSEPPGDEQIEEFEREWERLSALAEDRQPRGEPGPADNQLRRDFCEGKLEVVSVQLADAHPGVKCVREIRTRTSK